MPTVPLPPEQFEKLGERDPEMAHSIVQQLHNSARENRESK